MQKLITSVCCAAVLVWTGAVGAATTSADSSADYVDVGNGNYVAGYAYWIARPSFAD